MGRDLKKLGKARARHSLEARFLGILPLRNPLDGIDVDIRLAAVLNVRTSA
jgi:hypothetical protein